MLRVTASRRLRPGLRAGLRAVLVVGLSFLLVPTPAPHWGEAATTRADTAMVVRGSTWIIRGGSTFNFGRSGDVQVMGDWNGDDVATPGVFRAGRWYLRNRLASGGTEVAFRFGRPGDVPVVGDWDRDGDTTIGVVRDGTWLLRNANSDGDPHLRFAFGHRGDIPVTGDWNGNGRTGVGVVRGDHWYLRNTLSAGPAQVSFTFGRAGDIPITGDWNRDRVTTPGVVRGTTWYLRDRLPSGAANRVFTFGRCTDAALSTTGARTVPGVPASLCGSEWTTLPTTEKVVALTFDAGANAAGLPSILNTLGRTGTPATFFLTGAWTTRYPSLARQIAVTYPVGDHTVSHPDLTKLTNDQVRAQIIQADLTIRATTGRDPHPWFRFPYGARDGRTIGLANCLRYGSVRWTVDTLGWKGTSGGQSATTVTNRVLAALRPGAIVLMHVGSNPDDGTTLDAAALAQVIAKVEARGYRFVTLDGYR